MLSLIRRYASRSLYPNCSRQVSILSRSDEEESIFYLLDKSLAAGFYMVECLVSGEGVSGGARFFCQADADEKDAAFFTFRLHKLTKRIVFLKKDRNTIKIRLDCSSGKIHGIDFLRLVPLRDNFAFSRMLLRLQTTESVLKQRIQKRGLSFADALYTMYDRSFFQTADEHYQRWIDHIESEQVLPEGQSVSSPDESAYYFYCAPGYQLRDDAKAIMCHALNNNPYTQLVYVDEDQLDANGARKNHWFKPDWNPDLFLAQDYISTCYACRLEWYEKHQAVFEHFGPRLALSRLLPMMKKDAILHLPQILAHRIPSAADEAQQPDWVKQRAAALMEVLPVGVTPEAGLLEGSVRVRHPLPELPPLVSLLIPTRDGLSVLKPCIESILGRTTYPNYEILILDNQSVQPETLSWFKAIKNDKRVRVLKYDEPFNYSAINNYGARHANGSIIGLVNNDVEVISPDWLIEMVSQAVRPEIGCVGAKLYYSSGQIQHAGVILGLGDVAGHAHRFLGRADDGYHGRLKLVQNCSAVTAACLLVRREIYEAVAGLEEKHLTVAYNDVDFCIRVQEAGYRNLWTPYAELYHHESISRGEDDTPAKKARYQKEVAYMQKTWKVQLDNDPCYNPNLCRRREDFSLPDVLFLL